jgi:hypothetical protein
MLNKSGNSWRKLIKVIFAAVSLTLTCGGLVSCNTQHAKVPDPVKPINNQYKNQPTPEPTQPTNIDYDDDGDDDEDKKEDGKDNKK